MSIHDAADAPKQHVSRHAGCGLGEVENLKPAAGPQEREVGRQIDVMHYSVIGLVSVLAFQAVTPFDEGVILQL
jgi:hypothetical protein